VKPARPQLEIDPERDLAALRNREDTRLNSYGWIDRNTGTIHIPIDRAIDLLVAESPNLNGRTPATVTNGDGAASPR
jgi:hypothetical protein